MPVEEDYDGSRISSDDYSGSTRFSTDQARSLLDKTGLPLSEDEKWARDEGSDEEESDTVCCINRWWKLALFLFLWTLLIPNAVNWIHKDSYADNVIAPSEETQGVSHGGDYILDPNWDYAAARRVREYSWTVRETEYNPDGVFRPMLLINNQFPGPLVEVNEFDTIRVTVHNQGTNATSIHWHGLYQNGTNHMDGTVGVTQCPIAPGASFTYEFKVAGQSGTYWYHGHQGLQASDGLMGPLVIHAKDERSLQKVEYDTDRIVMVSDHYHDLSGALTRPYLAPDRENEEPVPDGILINGRAIRDCSALPHRQCDNTTANVGLPSLSVSPNQAHRLRFINVGALAEFQIQIDEHELAVTEVDGTDVRPQSFHRLNINPAQRYSVVVNTTIESADSFWLRIRMITRCFKTENKYLQSEVNAVVRYDNGVTPADQLPMPTSRDWSEALWVNCRDLNTTELSPVQEISAPEQADAFFYMRANFEIGRYRLSRGFFNTSSFRPNMRFPTLLRAIDGLQSSNETFTNRSMSTLETGTASAFVNDAAFDLSTEMVVQTSGVQTIDVLVHNFDDGNHPIHLHGYKYFVLAQGHGAPEHSDRFRGLDRENLNPLYSSLDLSNPLRRDTASVEEYGWLLLRFVADNPGAWAFHCHISWHTEAGLLMQFLTRTDIIGEMKLPEANTALCAAEGIERGAAPKDEDYREESQKG